MVVDRSAAFAHWAAERRAVAGSRGEVVRLMRYHAPMAGRAYPGQLPPLRNAWDLRRYARDVAEERGMAGADEFVRAMGRLWREYVASELEGPAAAEALAMVELDRDERRHAEAMEAVRRWARRFRSRAVCAADLCMSVSVREALGIAMQPPRPRDQVTPPMASRLVQSGLLGLEVDGWRVEAALPDRHQKVARWALVRLSDAGGWAIPA